MVIIGAARISRLLFLSCTCLEGLIDLADIVEICDIVKIRRRNVPAAHSMQVPTSTTGTEKPTRSRPSPPATASRLPAACSMARKTGYPTDAVILQGTSCPYLAFSWNPDCRAYSRTEGKVTTPVPTSQFDTRPSTLPPFSADDLNNYVTRVVHHQRDAAEKDSEFLDSPRDTSSSSPAAPLTLPEPAHTRNRPVDSVQSQYH